MSQTTSQSPSVADFLTEPLRVGEPLTAGPLSVFPLKGPDPRCGYVSFAQGRSDGVMVGELPTGASVNDLIIENPTSGKVLLFEGEEVLGAQQNRTFDTSVLVAAGAKLQVPVSCMEAGRWDGRRYSEPMEPAPQTASPRVRGQKAKQVRRNVAVGMAARAIQGEVWQEIGAMRQEYAHSPTGAMNDIYESRRGQLGEMCRAIPLRPGQVGSIAAINGEMRVLDYVSRPDVYVSLHERLVQGYALDALAGERREAPDVEETTARGFALLAGDSIIRHRTPGTGLGEEIRFDAQGVAGTGLVHERELIQLTVFPGEGPDSGAEDRPSRAGRVRRPSRRRA